MPETDPKKISAAGKRQPRQPVTSVDRSALKAYNAGQPLRKDGERLPYQEPGGMKPPSLHPNNVFNPGRFQMKTNAGILSSRGAGAGGGMGEDGGGGEAEQAPPVPAVAKLRANLLAKLMPEPAPYREDQGSRRMAAYRPGPTQASPGVASLMGVNGSGYSAGVMTTRERQRAMGQADSLQLPPAVRAAMQQQILAGDYGVTGRAAQIMAQVQNPRALESNRAQQVLAQELLGGEGARAHAARAQQNRDRYSEVAARNTAIATKGAGYLGAPGVNVGSVNGQEVAHGPGLTAMGLRDGVGTAALQGKLKQALLGASSKELQPMAAAGNWMAAEALGGVRSRENAREDDTLKQRYVLPAQARADGVVTAAQLRAQGVDKTQATQILKAQIQQQTAIYKAQMEAAGIDQQTQGRLLSAYMRANAEAGGDVVPWSQFHSQASQMMGQGQAPVPPAGVPASVPNPMGAQPPQAPVRPSVAAMPPQVQQVLNAGLTPEEWARFDQMPPADQQAFLEDVAAGRISP